MRSAIQQLRHVARRLSRAPLFTAITLITLAAGIGANTAIFSVINGVLLKPLPFAEPDRLVGVWHTAPGLGIKVLNASPATYFTYREEGRSFEDNGLWSDGAVTVTGLSEPERVETLSFTDGVLPILRVQPMLGRTFTRHDDTPGSPETVILSYAYWQRRFGGDRSVMGRRIVVDGVARDIIGVMPQNFRFLNHQPALILPFRLNRAEVFVGNFSFQGVARLKPGVSIEQANVDVARMLPMLVEKFRLPPGFNLKMMTDAKIGAKLHPLKEDLVGDVGKILWVLMGTVGIVLFIACANVANLFLVRAESRQQELAIRSALGAGWGRLARELLSESITLGLLGGALGLGLAYAALRLLVAMGPSSLPRLDEITIDTPVLLFTMAVSLVAGILFGLIPVFRFKGPHLAGALKEGGRGSSDGKERHRARSVLVVVQVALALVLLISSGLMIRTFQEMRKVHPGFVRPEEVLTLRISIPEALIKDPELSMRAHQQIRERIAQVTGVTAVSLSSSVPMDGSQANDPVFFEDFPSPEGQLPAVRRFKWIAPGYFQTMGTPILAGRDLTWTDLFNKAPVVLISENLAREHWKTPGAAVGKRIRTTPKDPWREIIGVVGPEREDGVSEKAPTMAYWPVMLKEWWGEPLFAWRNLVYSIRSPRVGSVAFTKEIREAVWSVNSNLPLARVRTLQEIYSKSMERTSFTLVMLAIAAGVALLLGVVGIYGVISYSISQRTREIGIRMALGAREQDVTHMFLRHGLTLTAIGIVMGLGASVGLTRLMAALLYGVSPMDPLTYIAVSAGLVAAAMLASYLPARKAAGIDPVQALKAE